MSNMSGIYTLYFVTRRCAEMKGCTLVHINISEHEKVVIKILQGSVVTQTVLGGLSVYPPVSNFLECICAKIMNRPIGCQWSGQSYLLIINHGGRAMQRVPENFCWVGCI